MFLQSFLIICLIVIGIFRIPGYTLVYYINKLYEYENTTRVFYDTNMDWCKRLRSNYKTIRSEYMNYTKYKSLKRFKEIDVNQTDFDITDIPWNVLFLRIYNRDTDKIKWFPKTYKLISQIPNCTLAMFSVLPPGKKIPLHVGPFKGILRYHLCLVSGGDRCFINVNGYNYSWKSGQDVIFDDTLEHFVENNSKRTRVILFIDIRKSFQNPVLEMINRIFLVFAQYNKTVYDIVYNTNQS
jgi:aspartyl/asparaginyl beta-hydroxylase (cupin superfamily)